MATCPELMTAFLFEKDLGADNVCSVYFATSIICNFWSKVDRGGTDDCWLWTASTIRGYGQFKVREQGIQRHVYAHRMSWLLTRGPIPDGLKVCHRCDVPRCCNPNHLFIGTQAENLADCRQKGRMPVVRRGFKLSIADRAEIRARLANRRRGVMAQLAREYGVSKTRIHTLAHERLSFSARKVCALFAEGLAHTEQSAASRELRPRQDA